jgi:hypothetical protein
LNRPDPQLAAFRRLLTDAHSGGHAKVDALVALAQRTIFVAPWPAGVDGYRTLVNSDGVAALPIFSGRDELENAARRYGWLAPDGTAPFAEIGARAALNYAREHELTFCVIDIASDHALEIARTEFEPLLTPSARRDSSGPFAGAGKLSSSLIRAVRPTPPPMAPVKMRPTPAPGTLSAPKAPAVEIEPSARSSAANIRPPVAAPGLASITVSALGGEPSDALLDALTNVMRNYPEIEWACLCNVARGSAGAQPGIGLRVDTSFRQRVGEILNELRRAAAGQAATLDMILLDDATVMRTARGEGFVFYPWRKR